MYVGRMYVEICPLGRADAALSQAHGTKTIQVPSLSAVVFTERSPVTAHEEALTNIRA